MMRINHKETRRIVLVIALLILAWSIKSFWMEPTSERAWESIGLFIGLIALLLAIATLVMLILGGFRKIHEMIFTKKEE